MSWSAYAFFLADIIMSSTVQDIIENNSNKMIPWQCNLEDVAKAHVLAAETPTAKGRYLVSTPHEVSDKAVVEVLKQRFPQFKFADDAADKPLKPFADVSKVCAMVLPAVACK